MAYHEIKGSRRYEYRYVEDGKFTGWMDGGNANKPVLSEKVNAARRRAACQK